MSRKLADIEVAVLNGLASLRDSDARIRKLRLNLTGARATLSIRRDESRAYGIIDDLRSEPQLIEDIARWERELEAESAANAILAKTVEARRELAENCRRHVEANRVRPPEPPYDAPRHGTTRMPGTTPTVARMSGAADIRSSLADGAPRMAATSTPMTRR